MSWGRDRDIQQRYPQECKGPRTEKSLVPSEIMRKSRAEGGGGEWGLDGWDA